MTPNPRGFRYDEQGAIARVTFERPETLNSLTFEIYRELTALLRGLATRPTVRVVVLTGAGRAFCSGGDVKEIIGELLHRDLRGLLEFTRQTCELVAAMRALPRPILASLNGPVAGAGAAIALASDLRVASDTAKVAFLFVNVGLAGADMGRATELLMTGDFIDAAEALRIGLYNRVVPAERLAEETDRLADRLAAGPTAALAATKDALNRELHTDLTQALEHEARVQAELMTQPDFREGFEAFVAKRRPRFR
jgi:enoyl-CoA hydratase/carnithine racemase